jgi:CubicO group peptidase (beta-lactamase class C family)
MLPDIRALVLIAFACPLAGQLPPAATAKIDAAVDKALADSGAPSVSLAVVKDGHIAYVKAYGSARLPATTASPEMRYSIGSVSKQFMAGAILMLAEEGKVSLDDKVGRYLPNLTRANEITIRQLLSHTSGYQDYYPLDYVAPFMQKPVTADEILRTWAGKALDFDPGTRWQYSNTNYVAAGRIVERITGAPFATFLKARIFGPLGMTSVIDLDEKSLTESDAAGYTPAGATGGPFGNLSGARNQRQATAEVRSRQARVPAPRPPFTRQQPTLFADVHGLRFADRGAGSGGLVDMPAEEVFGLLAQQKIAHGRGAGMQARTDLVERCTLRRAMADEHQRREPSEGFQLARQLRLAVFAGSMEGRRIGIAQASDVIAAPLCVLLVEVVQAKVAA